MPNKVFVVDWSFEGEQKAWVFEAFLEWFALEVSLIGLELYFDKE